MTKVEGFRLHLKTEDFQIFYNYDTKQYMAVCNGKSEISCSFLNALHKGEEMRVSNIDTV
jgi:hypothetical protein